MANTTLPALLGVGDHASRPAASAVGTGALYSCTDHGLVYQTDGSSWTTWASPGGGGIPLTLIDAAGDLIVGSAADTAARLAIGANGYVLTSNGTTAAWAAASGSGASWTLDVNEAGTSFTNFTAASGTWSSNGTEIIQTDTTALPRRVKYNNLVPIGYPFILQVDVYITSVGTGGAYRGGLLISDGTNDQGIAIYIDNGDNQITVDKDASAELATVAQTINTATWYTLRVVSGSGGWLSVYLDGTLKLNAPTLISTYRVGSKLPGLITNAASVKFRNFKFWSLSTGAP